MYVPSFKMPPNNVSIIIIILVGVRTYATNQNNNNKTNNPICESLTIGHQKRYFVFGPGL